MTCIHVPDLGHSQPSKPAIFHPVALVELQGMPSSIRQALGKLIRRLQWGESLSMPQARPMPIAGVGVEELRVQDESGQYRAFVVSKTPHGILVLHVFAKKSRETPHSAICLARRRLKEM